MKLMSGRSSHCMLWKRTNYVSSIGMKIKLIMLVDLQCKTFLSKEERRDLHPTAVQPSHFIFQKPKQFHETKSSRRQIVYCQEFLTPLRPTKLQELRYGPLYPSPAGLLSPYVARKCAESAAQTVKPPELPARKTSVRSATSNRLTLSRTLLACSAWPCWLILQTSAFPVFHCSSSPRAKVILCNSQGNGWKTLS